MRKNKNRTTARPPESPAADGSAVPGDKANFVPELQATSGAPKKMISGYWPLFIIWGMLLAVLFFAWLKTS